MFHEFMWQRFCLTGSVADYIVCKEEAESEQTNVLEERMPLVLMPV